MVGDEVERSERDGEGWGTGGRADGGTGGQEPTAEMKYI